jgi:hypothetical protein
MKYIPISLKVKPQRLFPFQSQALAPLLPGAHVGSMRGGCVAVQPPGMSLVGVSVHGGRRHVGFGEATEP